MIEFQEHLAREMTGGDACIDGIAVGDRQPARPREDGRREAALRRYRLRREKVVLHRPMRPTGFPCCSCRMSRASWPGRRPSTNQAGARFVEGWRRRVPKIVLTINHVGRGLLRDGRPGVRSGFHLPGRRTDGRHGGGERDPGGARTGDRARETEQAAARCGDARVDEMRAEHQLDARYAAARGFVDAIIYPEDTRDASLALRAARPTWSALGPSRSHIPDA